MIVTPVAFSDPPLLNTIGVHQPWALRTVIEVRTDAGLTGLGESYGHAQHLEELRRCAPLLVGLDVFDINGLHSRVAGVVDGASDQHQDPSSSRAVLQVFSPFEVAFLDLQGHAIGRPVHDLLGGKVRDSVDFAGYLFYKWAAHPGAEADEWGAALDPAGIVEQARRMVARHGFRSLKLKGGVLRPEEELEAVQELRTAFPDHPLRLDPNCAWTVATAREVANRVEGLLEYLEDPTPGIAGMAAVAADSPVPLATNMCVVDFDHLPPALSQGAVDVVLSDHHYWGGLTRSTHLATICRTWGIGISMHSNSHLGISLAAMTQLGAAMPHLTYAADTHAPWQSDSELLETPLRFVNGAVAVPDAPGLGITLDPDALARLHQNYLACGIRQRDDTGYMRSIEPGFAPRRW
ncbi:glucarate dehydratase family protein [Pseudactinotalea sp.]|uniref:glucarate dehydratase family protein n=1 Tax=Pseudactinotalea sp. TaxID=1926260 RepID=UPI003B3B56C6